MKVRITINLWQAGLLDFEGCIRMQEESTRSGPSDFPMSLHVEWVNAENDLFTEFFFKRSQFAAHSELLLLLGVIVKEQIMELANNLCKVNHYVLREMLTNPSQILLSSHQEENDMIWETAGDAEEEVAREILQLGRVA